MSNVRDLPEIPSRRRRVLSQEMRNAGIITGTELARHQTATPQVPPNRQADDELKRFAERDFLQRVWRGLKLAAEAEGENAEVATCSFRGPSDLFNRQVKIQLPWVPHHARLSNLALALTNALTQVSGDSNAKVTLQRLGIGRRDYHLVARAKWTNIGQFGFGREPRF